MWRSVGTGLAVAIVLATACRTSAYELVPVDMGIAAHALAGRPLAQAAVKRLEATDGTPQSKAVKPPAATRVAAQARAASAVQPAPPKSPAPDEDLLGKQLGYPVGRPDNWFDDEKARVGSFSHLDRIMPSNTLQKSNAPLPLPTAGSMPKIEYWFGNETRTIDQFLAKQRITGLLLIKDGQTLIERYQYDRTPADRLVSHSMAKSLVSIAVGIAFAEHKIVSLDDLVSKYVPGLAGAAYGETSIRSLLRMGSGVRFREDYDGNDDAAHFAIRQ
jgi:hypothetical protein